MKATKLKEHRPNEIKLEMILTQGKIAALKSSLDNWNTTLARELRDELDAALLKENVSW